MHVKYMCPCLLVADKVKKCQFWHLRCDRKLRLPGKATTTKMTTVDFLNIALRLRIACACVATCARRTFECLVDVAWE